MRAIGDFSPVNPGESVVEAFDFTTGLATGDSLFSTTWACTVAVGADPTPASRLIDGPQIQGNKTLQRVGGLLVGVTYVLTATVVTVQGDTLELWAFLSCEAVGC